MSIIKIEVTGFQCDRCGYVWQKRIKERKLPLICPKCKSASWNIPKKK